MKVPSSDSTPSSRPLVDLGVGSLPRPSQRPPSREWLGGGRDSSRFFSTRQSQRPSGLLDLGLPPSLRYQQQQKQELSTRSALGTAELTGREYVIYEHRPSYALFTDPTQEDKATEIKLLSVQRPHMRAFHFAWLSFFAAFFGWFTVPALLPTIQTQLGLSDDEVANSDVAALASTAVGSLLIGPLCDRYGARTIQSALLIFGAIPVASAALVFDGTGLLLVRFFIGLIGCSFVVSAYWTSTMFSTEVIGSANAITAGWGSLGAGATYLISPLLVDAMTVHDNLSDSTAWRLTLVVPAVLMLVVGMSTFFLSDDCPLGNFSELKKVHAMAETSRTDMWRAFAGVTKKPVVYVLALQYACCFGVQLQVQNVLSLYFYDNFVSGSNSERQLSSTQASLIASCFGLMCLFARAIGGFFSDAVNRKFDMKGRLWAQFGCLSLQGVALYAFSQQRSLEWSVPSLACFGLLVQASAGSTFALVPYVYPEYTGATSGIVGAGGNLGGLLFGLLFKVVGSRIDSFEYMSFVVMVGSLFTAITFIDGQRTLLGKNVFRGPRGAGIDEEAPPPRRIRGFYM